MELKKRVLREVKIPIPYLTRELHIVTERPNTEPKLTPSVLKNWETEVQFSSGVGFGGTVLSLSYDRRERERETERGTKGRRGRERHKDRERRNGGRGLFFLLPPCERERVVEGRAGGGEREG